MEVKAVIKERQVSEGIDQANDLEEVSLLIIIC